MTSEIVTPTPLTRRGVPTDSTLRILALGTLVNRASGGAVFTTFALYFTRHVGLSAPQVGFALSIAAVAGAIAQVPGGQLGDLRGPREVMRAFTLLTGVATAALAIAHSFWALVAVITLVTAAQMAANAVRNGYIARIAVGGEGVRFKAYLRAVTNVAMTFGALVGGVALWIDEPWAYVGVFLLDAATSIFTGVLVQPAPPPRAGSGPRRRRTTARGRPRPPLRRGDAADRGAVHALRGARDRHPAVDQRAHRGTDVDGGDPARAEHDRGRAVPGTDEPRRRGRHPRRAGRLPRGRVDRGVVRGDRLHRRRRPRGRRTLSCWSTGRCTWSARWSPAAGSGA